MRRGSVLGVLIILLAGCAGLTPREEASPPGPRERASLELTLEGRKLLNAGEPDSAIRLLEQAIGLNPDNGQSYYYLAEAWMEKGVLSQAREFNGLARFYLQDDAEWTGRVETQAHEILQQQDPER